MKLKSVNTNLDIQIDCFISAVTFLLEYYEVDESPLYLNDISYFKSSDIGVETIHNYEFNEIMDKLGFEYNKVCIEKNNFIQTLQFQIDGGHPIIVDVDMYYNPVSPGTYHRTHARHALYVYGYEDEMFNVIEINWINSSQYKEHKISFEELEKCYFSYKDNFKEAYVHLFYKKNEDSCLQFDYKYEYKTFVKKNIDFIREGILQLKRNIAVFVDECSDHDKILHQSSYLHNNFSNVIRHHTVEMSLLNKYFSDAHAIADKLSQSIVLWMGIRAGFYKMMCQKKYNEKLVNSSVEKLLAVQKYEEEAYNELLHWLSIKI